MPKQTPEAKKIIRDAVRIYASSDLDGKNSIRHNASMVTRYGLSSVRTMLGISDHRMRAVETFLRIIKNR